MSPKKLREKVGAMTDKLLNISEDSSQYFSIWEYVNKLEGLNAQMLKELPRFIRWKINRTYVCIPMTFGTLIDAYGICLPSVRKGLKISEATLKKSVAMLKGWVPPSSLRHQAKRK